MSVTSGLAVYVLVWWLTFFAVLPFGIRSQHEEETTPGTDPGAPVLPRMLARLIWTTLISAAIFAVLYVFYAYRLFSLDIFPGPPNPS